jgi:ATP-binding cassette, subfamily B, multidrug efflux pump
LLGLHFLRWLTAISTGYLMQMLGQTIVQDLRGDIFQHILRMDASYFQTQPVGRLVNRTTFDVQSLAELFSDAFAQGVRDLCFVLVLIGVMLSLDSSLALLLIAAFPLLALIGYGYRAYARGALRTNAAVQSRMNAWLAENLAGMRENHLYGTEEKRRQEYKALTDAHQVSITRVLRSWSFLRPAMLLVTGLATTLVLLAGTGRITAGTMTVGVLITFLQYTVRLWVPVRNLTEKFNVIQNALTSGERIMDVLDAKPALTDAAQSDPTLHVRHGAIRFEDVTFCYPGKLEPIIERLNFEAPAGTMLALVGDTGAGKTTIARMISRFYDPVAGQVFIDGHNAKAYRLTHLRTGVAIVPQEVVLFAGSVRDNITLGRPITDARIRKCMEAVRADGLLSRLPQGLDTVLQEGGRTLSTGERQLLSFARALVIDPPILVLDEATANIDTQTELLIQQALTNLTRGRTSLVIAHRLSTIRHADQILVLRAGKVIERGNHPSLLAQGGEYAHLYRLHFSDVARSPQG